MSRSTDCDANGYYSHTDQRIVVRDGLAELQRVKTAIHEIAHALLHAKGAEEADADRSTREVQAESVAYVVCRALGLDTSDYSFGYVAGWSADKELKALKASLDAIVRTSDKISRRSSLPKTTTAAGKPGRLICKNHHEIDEYIGFFTCKYVIMI